MRWPMLYTWYISFQGVLLTRWMALKMGGKGIGASLMKCTPRPKRRHFVCPPPEVCREQRRDHRRVAAGGAEQRLADAQRRARQGIGEPVGASVDQLARHLRIKGLRIRGAIVLPEQVVPGAGEPVAADAAVLALFVAGLPAARQPDDREPVADALAGDH